MKKYLSFVLIAAVAALASINGYAAGGFKKQKFQEVFYLEHGGKGDASGRSADNAAAISTRDVFAIPAGAVVENAYVIVDVAVVGLTSLDVGDDDDADGYCLNADITLGTPAAYCANEADKGAYLHDSGASGSKVKYYSASGKEVKIDVVGPSSAGKAKIIVEGFLL